MPTSGAVGSNHGAAWKVTGRTLVIPPQHNLYLLHKEGKMVHELRPNVAWDKGKAVAWLAEQEQIGGDAGLLYIGDDVADEDALAYVESAGGVGIKVSAEANPTTLASFVLRDPSEVRDFLAAFVPP